MTSRWQQVPIDRARRHPLYGVGGWLIVFSVGLALGLMKELGTVRGEAYKVGMTMGDFFSIDHPAVSYIKLALALQTVVVAVIYCLLFSKHPNFRRVSTALLVGGWPAAALLGFVHPFPGFGGALVLGLFSWAISCAVWVTYLQRSQRVRVTFEHCVASSTTVDVQSSVPLAHTGAVAAPSVPPATPAPHASQRLAEPSDAVVSSSASTEEFWATAIIELEGDSRRPGLWARSFAEAQGDHARARATYLTYRARELEEQAVTQRAQALAEQAALRRAREQQASAEAGQVEAYRRSVKELDTSPEAVLQAFVDSIPHHAAYVFSLRNEVGGTLLHTAAREGFVGLAKALLAKGADPSIAGPKVLLPHEVAARNGHMQLAERLEQSLNARDTPRPNAVAT